MVCYNKIVSIYTDVLSSKILLSKDGWFNNKVIICGQWLAE